MNSIIETENIVKWIVALHPTTDLRGIPDNVYPFAGVEDQWAVVIGEKQVRWSPDYSKACLMYIEILQVQRKHAMAGGL